MATPLVVKAQDAVVPATCAGNRGANLMVLAPIPLYGRTIRQDGPAGGHTARARRPKATPRDRRRALADRRVDRTRPVASRASRGVRRRSRRAIRARRL